MSRGLPTTFLDLLSNSLVLGRLTPYLPIASLLALAATSHTVKALLDDAPETYRYVDLSPCKSAIVPDMSVDRGGINWRAERMDEALTEDDIYCGPLRGIFSMLAKRSALVRIQTLVLDGLTVPADLVQEVITNTNVRILSIRECRQLNHFKLIQGLKYAVRPSRPDGTPRLRGLYVFGPKDSKKAPDAPRRAAPTTGASAAGGVTTSQGAQIGAEWNAKSQEALTSSLPQGEICEDRWYQTRGKMFGHNATLMKRWGEALQACEGIIAFDAVLCRGPRHDGSNASATALEHDSWLPPAVANITLGQRGCTACKSSPEGSVVYGQSTEAQLPLLEPPPRHSTSIDEAQRPTQTSDHQYPRLFVRCQDCLASRWCERCFKWWDEKCYPGSMIGTRTAEMGVVRDCFGCGRTCEACKATYIRTCRHCRQEYCIEDNDGATDSACDWCNHSGRRTRELY